MALEQLQLIMSLPAKIHYRKPGAKAPVFSSGG